MHREFCLGKALECQLMALETPPRLATEWLRMANEWRVAATEAAPIEVPQDPGTKPHSALKQTRQQRRRVDENPHEKG
jgi:hypothetical protein